MSRQTHPAIDRYLKGLATELGDLAASERAEVVEEIRNHAAEAILAGRDPADVLEHLGSPEQLARAYRVELALERPRRVRGAIGRFFATLGVLAVAGFPAFIVIVVLGSITLAFIVGGSAAFVGGVGSIVLPGSLVESTLPIPHVFSELLTVVAGIALTLLGFVVGVLLFLYVRWMRRTIRRMLDRLRPAPQ
jgi:uncharacterized membrane protein